MTRSSKPHHSDLGLVVGEVEIGLDRLGVVARLLFDFSEKADKLVVQLAHSWVTEEDNVIAVSPIGGVPHAVLSVTGKEKD